MKKPPEYFIVPSSTDIAEVCLLLHHEEKKMELGYLNRLLPIPNRGTFLQLSWRQYSLIRLTILPM
jgi:hypothetical protein